MPKKKQSNNQQNQNLFTNPLFTFLLLMAANAPDPAGRLNSMGQAVNSMRQALSSINAGMEAFHTQVVPMVMQNPEKK